MPKGIRIRNLSRMLVVHAKEIDLAHKALVGDADLKEVADRLILTLTRTLTMVTRMDSDEIEAQL